VASAIANVFPQGSHFLSTAARPATYAVEQWAYWASQVSNVAQSGSYYYFACMANLEVRYAFRPCDRFFWSRATRDARHGGV